ncbi:MAG: mechanosensitive ion channel family protein, partial [Deltaproteobacteria bacterium]|nr:mechanosensitive ion channel family protein [Deltaproteobacteria bacterium]
RTWEILNTERISIIIIALIKAVRLAVSLTVIYLALSASLALFPVTRDCGIQPVLRGLFLSFFLTIVTLALWKGGHTFFDILLHGIGALRGTAIRAVKLKTLEVVSEERIFGFVSFAIGAVQFIAGSVLLYFYLTLLLSFFTFTATWAGKLFEYFLGPIWTVLHGIAQFLPNLFFIVVILFMTRYLIKFVKIIFIEIEKGTFVLSGFHPDWAIPTYKISRFLIIVFAAIVIFPYLPGSHSNVFRGISVFFGILLSLGSAGVVGNIMAGIVITYMRPFKIGDRVKIADTLGDVIEKTLLVTRIRTIKNVDVSIPNALVLTNHIINFSSMAKETGVIFHTTVTIGYDAPWRKVHESLISAARATGGIKSSPEPFVLQTALNDFHVSYELNAYTDRPENMASIYSMLHENIQDKFNERGIEIMSPHYTSIRDGNRSTIPEGYLPKNYNAPSFRFSSIVGNSDKGTDSNAKQ